MLAPVFCVAISLKFHNNGWTNGRLRHDETPFSLLDEMAIRLLSRSAVAQSTCSLSRMYPLAARSYP
jgi:hypothetical protein